MFQIWKAVLHVVLCQFTLFPWKMETNKADIFHASITVDMIDYQKDKHLKFKFHDVGSFVVFQCTYDNLLQKKHYEKKLEESSNIIHII